MSWIPVAEASKKIREALKAQGITSRQVSVRSDSYSMGSAIRCEIKDPDIKKATVEEAARGEEHYRVDEYSGEILSGGNRFVNICYSMEALTIMADSVRPQVEAAIAKIKENHLIPVKGTPYLVGFDQNGYNVTVWHKDPDRCGCIAHAYNAEIAPEVIGRLMAQE